MTELISKLSDIQVKLNAPKSQLNKFGGYNYRNCEDILQALKPFMVGVAVTITDEIQMVGDRFYIKATATITDGKDSYSVSAYARESLTKKGMDDSQLTGSTSSYARKYALNGLFLIDDNKDADSTDNSNPERVLTEMDLQWISAVNKDKEVLNQIADIEYKKFIKSKVNK